jgi:hypothetical protein
MLIYEGKTCTIHYPENHEGETIIHSKLPHDRIGLDRGEILVNSEDILEFVAKTYVKPKLIQCIENTPPLDMLINQISPNEE